MIENPRATIGGNNPPAPIDPIAELHGKLAIDYRELSARRDELSLAFDRLPPKIADDDDAGKVGDFVRMLQTLERNADAARLSAKAPFVALASAVDGFFGKIIEPTKKLRTKLQPRQTAYLEEKAAAERREREEAAERMRLEAKRKAEEAERAAEEARKAEEERARKRAEEEAAYRRAMQEQERAAQAARDAEAANKRDDEAAAAAARKAAEDADAAAKAALEAARKTSEEEAEASRKADAAGREADKAEAKLETAARIERQASRLEDSARDKPSGLARTRGDYGSVSTLQTRWVGELRSRRDLDLEALRAFIPEDALAQAIGAFVRAGGRDLRGAAIFEETIAQTR